jgi:protein-S-isoprenylcysteine O-methyltransferase Ste14
VVAVNQSINSSWGIFNGVTCQTSLTLIPLKTRDGKEDVMIQNPMQKESQQQRSDLTGEHTLGDAGQLILACLFITIWVLDSFILNYTTFLNHIVPLAIRLPIGIVLLAVSGYLAITSLAIVFGEKRENPCVVRKGVFRIMRHPMYLSEILLYLGLLMMSVSLAAAVVWVLAIVFLYHISRYEERLLLERFGQEYQQYMQEVPMWIPRLCYLKKQ